MSTDFFEVRCSEEAARLLPWYVTGRLSALDKDRVTTHLQRCEICRNDVIREGEVHAVLKTQGRIEFAPQAGLSKTLSRIDELARDPPPTDTARRKTVEVAASRRSRRSGTLQWLTAAVVLQAVALGWLGVTLQHASRGEAVPGYHTLTSDMPTLSGPHLRVVFTSSMTLADLSALLTAHHLVIVHGPTSAQAYTLASTDPLAHTKSLDSVVAKLRADRRVVFAEPAVNDAARP